MRRNYRLLFGPLAAALLALGIIGLPMMIPHYSQIHQTVSEIGEVGSPAHIPFTIMLIAVSVSILIFASGLRTVSIRAGLSPLAAYVAACMAVSAAGVGIFAFPHPLHNDFGLSELIAYQGPVILALTWRRDPRFKSLVTFSWTMFTLMWVAIALNLAILDRSSSLWSVERPFYGLVQRTLFIVWFGWIAAIGLQLFRQGIQSASTD